MTKTSTPGLDGKAPLGVPDAIASLYAEYSLPAPFTGLTITGGVSYTAMERINSLNTLSIPSVLLGDVGLRYHTQIYGAPTMFRLDVDNVGGVNYWTDKGDTQIYPGNPRIVAFSVELGL